MDSKSFSSPRSSEVDSQGDRLLTSNGIDSQGDRLWTSNEIDIQGDRLWTSNEIDIQGDRLRNSNGVDSQGDRLLTSNGIDSQGNRLLTSNKDAHSRGACPPVSKGVECYSQGTYPLTFIKGAVNQNECQSLVSSGNGGEQSPDNTKEEDTCVDSKSEAAILRDEGADEEEGDQISKLFVGLPSRDQNSFTQVRASSGPK